MKTAVLYHTYTCTDSDNNRRQWRCLGKCRDPDLTGYSPLPQLEWVCSERHMRFVHTMSFHGVGCWVGDCCSPGKILQWEYLWRTVCSKPSWSDISELRFCFRITFHNAVRVSECGLIDRNIIVSAMCHRTCRPTVCTSNLIKSGFYWTLIRPADGASEVTTIWRQFNSIIIIILPSTDIIPSECKNLPKKVTRWVCYTMLISLYRHRQTVYVRQYWNAEPDDDKNFVFSKDLAFSRILICDQARRPTWVCDLSVHTLYTHC